MRLVSFDPYRCLDIPGITYLKPELIFRHKAEIQSADWILYPEYWQINSLVYGLNKRIFPSVNSYHLGHDKIEMTRAFWMVCPQHVPETLIRPATPAAIEEIEVTLDFPFIAKEARNSMGRGVHLIEDRRMLRDYAAANQVLYMQEYLPIKKDLRVVYVGDRVVSAYWRVGREGSHLNNVAQGGEIDMQDIPPQALTLVETLCRQLGINHAGFDVAEVGGHFYLLEFNPLFGTQALLQQQVPLGRIILDYLQRHTPHPTEPEPPVFRLTA